MPASDHPDSFDIITMDDGRIEELMNSLRTGLTVQEAKDLQTRILKRPPTLAELILFGIEGSEHCSYKSSRPYLKQFTTEGMDVIVGAKEDAGIVRVARDAAGKGYAIVLSHESHNHPSQLVPYEGAATGVGGNVRDVCCMGARVIALADDLRFGDISKPRTKWLYEEVVRGIAGYGNPIGVPSVAGGLQFDKSYEGNCLVTVVTLGAVEEDGIIHSYAPENADGYDLILVGKPTDSSGFGGASFASFQLDDAKKEVNKGAVQEPNAFLGRHIIRSSEKLFEILKEKGELHRVGFKDLGAGGIACASVELAESGGYGAVVDIDKVHVAEENLAPHVVLCAETQERYLWASPPDLTSLIMDHYNVTYALGGVSAGAAARVIGRITADTRYVVTSGAKVLVDAPASDVTKGFLYQRDVAPALPPLQKEPVIKEKNVGKTLLDILSHPNVASRAPLYNTYDKQVQGMVAQEAGAGDAGVLTPFDDPRYPAEIRNVGITLTTDQNPRHNAIDAYQGAVNAVVEAWCNTVVTGARPVALSDCLCYGNPEKPNHMRQFADGAKGVADSSRFLEVPVIAGNVSLYNESSKGDRNEMRAIPPSPMIAMVGKLENAAVALSPAFTGSGNTLLMIGERKDECGGSIWYSLHDELGARIPEPDLSEIKAAGLTLCDLTAEGRILSAHDISEGGIAAALSEQAIASGYGLEVIIPGSLQVERLLFSESFGFVMETAPEETEVVVKRFKEAGVSCVEIGRTTDRTDARIRLNSVVDIPVSQAAHTYATGLTAHIR
ncbi:phosphoribosylformylglycinamidine synthase subunit PurL [Parasphaerochaeta coccoides]|uniref:Phosphoribosylformylglycinamidine synthase subunit PurL n=1 Tax=Parasphaerochaeta coccoides (strain ATCC BAA-1237 / DSM 17374 / SPN1) TaxID=760011 RepID=F4GHW8_PARC1|nr:phosphoribosylformylglycinamidine synthase subunit PurL [Parasphaerochaeta coccoides]AEC02081.1 phosphoribosylformylglycinamidine synthase subunit II [Parasphaerochaeta coccoides DSM 17374]